ncbi:Enolase C-terminal domain-like [Roseomonas rosea]|uniref:Enolase C-terminal domain-like n=1 Tax=Muricoccus roseus TaxID=198092 RepID=A0A1M6HH89_9PROT|nr:Enolase C-terminal domain-like [Roseomonas rosea]
MGLVACLHVAAAVPIFAIQEYPTGFKNLELRSDGVLLGSEFVDAPPKAENGFVRIPTRPGLGLAVLEDVVVQTKPTAREVSMRRHRDGSPIDQWTPPRETADVQAVSGRHAPDPALVA